MVTDPTGVSHPKRLALDTNILIPFFLETKDVVEWINDSSDVEFFIPGIVLLELIQGSGEDRLAKLDAFRTDTTVVRISAEKQEDLESWFRARIELHLRNPHLAPNRPNKSAVADGLIAFTCLEHDLALATLDKEDFKSVPGLELVELPFSSESIKKSDVKK